MWAVDLSHTAHTIAQSGIQQVCRSFYRAWNSTSENVTVTYDPFARMWRRPDHQETIMLQGKHKTGNRGRSSRWSISQKMRGLLMRIGSRNSDMSNITGVFCPEIFDTKRFNSLFNEQWSSKIKKVALFHDAIPIKFPDWCAPRTVDYFPSYLHHLSKFDHVICVSQTSREDLIKYWEENAITPAPTTVIPLGIPSARQIPKSTDPNKNVDSPTLLCVGTLEPRKNHLALLTAAEELWKEGYSFQLKLIGMVGKPKGELIYNRINELIQNGHPIEWSGDVSDMYLNKLYSTADLIVYVSLYEGFGLPVLEALGFGKPVLTTNKGALGELAHLGGCLVCDGSAHAIRNALHRVTTDNQLLAQLTRKAKDNDLRTIENTACEINDFLHNKLLN